MHVFVFSTKDFERPFLESAGRRHGHELAFTREALESIAGTTLRNVDGFARGEVPAENLVGPSLVA